MIVDAHLDLAMNALEWNRDLSSAVDDIRARETGQTDKPDRGNGTVVQVNTTDWQQGSVEAGGFLGGGVLWVNAVGSDGEV